MCKFNNTPHYWIGMLGIVRHDEHTGGITSNNTSNSNSSSSNNNTTNNNHARFVRRNFKQFIPDEVKVSQSTVVYLLS